MSSNCWPITDETSQISLLDPRAKLSAFRSENEKNKVKELVRNLTEYSISTTTTTAAVENIADTRNFFRRLRDNEQQMITLQPFHHAQAILMVVN